MNTHTATIVVDLGFGDAGKGSIVDFLSRSGTVSAVVRFNGGAQAAHNVITPDGRHHTFAQFGSGTFVPGVVTHLSRFMLIDPIAMMNEAEHLVSLGVSDPFARLSVDAEALVVTPFQKAGNRLREVLRGDGRHGSCGMGVGETMHDTIVLPELAVFARDLRDPAVLLRKFKNLQEFKQAEFRDSRALFVDNPLTHEEVVILTDPTAPAYFAELFWKIAMRFRVVPRTYLKQLAARGSVLFEGAQGVLLDEWHGFHPYTTWSTTTFSNAATLLQEIGYSDPVEKLGVLRAYATRHGPGPFPTEDLGLTMALPDQHNKIGAWQGGFRVGWFDAVLARYAIDVCGGVDALAITNIDRLNAIGAYKIATAYDIPKQYIGGREQAAIKFGAEEIPGIQRAVSFKPKTILPDLSYQEMLTRLLEHSIPVYDTVSTDSTHYLREIERHAGVPISIASYGPTACHKQFIARGECLSAVA